MNHEVQVRNTHTHTTLDLTDGPKYCKIHSRFFE